jgi:hypothetical protein
MKNGMIDRLAKTAVTPNSVPVDRQQGSTDCFDHKSGGDDISDECFNLSARGVREAFLNGDAVGDGQSLAGDHQKNRLESHQTQTADLEADENNDLTEDGKGRPGINDRQTGHTSCRNAVKKASITRRPSPDRVEIGSESRIVPKMMTIAKLKTTSWAG